MIFDSEKFLNLEFYKKYNTFQKTFKKCFSVSLQCFSQSGVKIRTRRAWWSGLIFFLRTDFPFSIFGNFIFVFTTDDFVQKFILKIKNILRDTVKYPMSRRGFRKIILNLRLSHNLLSLFIHPRCNRFFQKLFEAINKISIKRSVLKMCEGLKSNKLNLKYQFKKSVQT